MLGLGWTEIMVIGIVALIVIGPKDLPVVMNRVGKVVGQIRRMGSEFQREINKTTGLDEVRNLRNSIAAPLKKTSDEIRREFNAMTPTGPKPSGAIKPADPKSESVVDEIRTQAGMTVEADKPIAPAVTQAPAKPAKSTATKRAPVKAAAAPTRPVITTELPPVAATAAKPVRKLRTKAAGVKDVPVLPSEPADSPEPVVKPARKPRTPKVAPAKDIPALPTEPADSPATKTPRTRKPRKVAEAKAENQ